MKVYEGKSIFKGIAIGKIFFYQKGTQQVKRVKIDDVEAERNVMKLRMQKQSSS